MYIKRWLVIFIIVLLLTTGIIVAENDSPITLSFAGVKVNSEVRVIEKDGAWFISLPFLKYLHVINDWNPTTGDLDLRFGKFSFKLNEDAHRLSGQRGITQFDPCLLSNGTSALVAGGVFICGLGLVTTSEDRKQISLDWQHNYPLGIENIKYQGRPAFLLIGVRAFKTNSFLLTQPNRLVVDVKGVKAHFTLDCNVG